jgi:hypothetical protein
MLVNKKDSFFRRWTYEVWLEHKEEILNYTNQTVAYDGATYFKKYKWWLKTIYKEKYGNR